ncbi:cell wall hydrolase/autolysin [Catenulispora acidiphila DSM 44928]|uniref:Cell wall hydrolase/autolysin n=1 Tax=Catenulispora acidiphila (strain DSM 44928 / JCM 14897 / NBRC 102108 / NRRL B-24433 / ID139908) TaxID=479433 RepID=C7Q5P6_CATAD|nr:N-acetylmuramoyl-L-alanine amidase [Catenulispora acidiphila]ACU77857.1 cell wall hydrolase/autolysin [Catenulispora acidiphila DSM 44928]
MTTEPTYRRGDSGPAVAAIRERLARLGLIDAGSIPAQGEPVFDDAVENAVRHFQQTRRTTVDGMVTPGTMRLLEEASWRLGDRDLVPSPAEPPFGDDVAELQRSLLTLGFDCGRVNGAYDPTTVGAVREFQRNVGLPATGVTDLATVQALNRLNRRMAHGGLLHAMRESEAIQSAGPALPGKTLVLDPGHGGADTGVRGGGLIEAEVVFDIADRVKTRLEKLSVTTHMSHGPGGSPDDRRRAEKANELGADLLISLHCDFHSNPAASGVAAFYYGNDRFGHSSPTGERFAGLVQREVTARTGLANLGTHGMTWDVLRYTQMPAVRIELGYLTSPHDAALLASQRFRESCADAIVVAVQRLYLPPESDAPTGVLRLAELRSH